MLNHLSWTSYFEAVILLLVVYYLFIGLRFYPGGLRRLLGAGHAKNQPGQPLPAALVYQEPDGTESGPATPGYPDGDNLPDDSITQADTLMKLVKNRIAARQSDSPYARAAIIRRIKEIFKEHTWLKDSPHRPAINELVVTECKKTGTALLTEQEVDQWWSD
jgi:hypothetical protein